MQLKGKQVTVLGMARSGVAAAELLLAQGAHVRAIDQNPQTLILNGEPYRIEPQSPAAFVDADLIVLSPGVPPDLTDIKLARQRGVPVIGDLELASWFLRGKMIGITGSNGKTTTTALVAHILNASGIAMQVGGNIGRPPAIMVNASRDEQWNVLELSSFQLETTETFHAQVGAVLNITPDHLDRHHTMKAYIDAKGRLFANQTAGDFAVLNADDATCIAYASHLQAKVLWFSSTRECDGAFLGNGSIFLRDTAMMEQREVPLRGVHNLENTMAAALIANLAGATDEQIRSAVMTFPGVEHRLEFVRELQGVAWYNDSKATNVDATLKAIAAFDRGLWVILGGKDKDSDYSALAGPLAAKARGVFLIGAAANKIASQLEETVFMVQAGTLANAVALAQVSATKGDTVLLAPACASFDQFQNFEHRGREFKRLIHELGGRS